MQTIYAILCGLLFFAAAATGQTASEAPPEASVEVKPGPLARPSSAPT